MHNSTLTRHITVPSKGYKKHGNKVVLTRSRNHQSLLFLFLNILNYFYRIFREVNHILSKTNYLSVAIYKMSLFLFDNIKEKLFHKVKVDFFKRYLLNNLFSISTYFITDAGS